MKVLVLVDGEHYPAGDPVGARVGAGRGHEVVAALLLGGVEKPAADRAPIWRSGCRRSPGRRRGARRARSTDLIGARGGARPVRRTGPGLPGTDGTRSPSRWHMASRTWARTFGWTRPSRARRAGTDARRDRDGEATGKTAIAGEVARVAAGLGLEPVVVAMGRGGPAAPQVAEAGSVTVEVLLDLVRRGQHAASDYLEDAVTTGVTTIGARRAAGGLAGAPFVSSVRPRGRAGGGARSGYRRPGGQRSSIPPVPWDAGILVVPATVPPRSTSAATWVRSACCYRTWSLLRWRAAQPGSRTSLPLRSHVQRLRNDTRFIVTEFEPLPLGDVRGRDVFFATTAPGQVAARQVEHLEAAHGCRVVGGVPVLPTEPGWPRTWKVRPDTTCS